MLFKCSDCLYVACHSYLYSKLLESVRRSCKSFRHVVLDATASYYQSAHAKDDSSRLEFEWRTATWVYDSPGQGEGVDNDTSSQRRCVVVDHQNKFEVHFQIAKTPLGDCEPFRMASQGHVQTLTLAHTRKVQGVMQMRQTRQMQIDEDACIRNWTDQIAPPEICNLSATTLILTTLIQRPGLILSIWGLILSICVI